MLGSVAILLSFLFAGCDEKESYKLAFNHQVHVVEYELACQDCHGKMSDGLFARAGHDACMECHDDWIDTKKVTGKTCGMCHKVNDLQAYSQKPTTNIVTEVSGVFIHTSTLSNRCADCHGMVLDKKLKIHSDLTGKDKILIRDEAHQWGLECTACHENMDPKTEPPSHSRNWTKRHGPLGIQPDNTCNMCHSPMSCRECHQVTEPSSHNNLFRLKTHGIQGAWDRERCLVCHQQDMCITCHESTRPMSHNAGWNKKHCVNCHSSTSTGTGCALCHKNAGIDTHPNPHSAGWSKRHCFSCHEDSASGNQCQVCHPGNIIQYHDNDWSPVHERLPPGVDCYYCHGL